MTPWQWLLAGGAVAGGALLLFGGDAAEESFAEPPGKGVTRWAGIVQDATKDFPNVLPSVVLATIEHESGGNAKAMSYYRKPELGDPKMPKEVKESSAKEQLQWKRDNWHGHAYGLMQLIPETGHKYGEQYGLKGAGYALYPGQPGNFYDGEKNIRAGVAFLSSLFDRYDGDKRAVYASYYAGAGNVSKRGVEHYADYINASLTREAKYHPFDV